MGALAGLGMLGGLGANPVQAADPFDPVVVAEEERWRWSVTPRFWYFWQTDDYFSTELRFQQRQESIGTPFAGATVSVTPGGGALGGTTFSLTALYGEGDGAVSGQGVFVGGLPANLRTRVTNKRLDVEAIAQIPMAEGLNGILGARLIHFDRQESGRLFSSPPPVPLPCPPTCPIDVAWTTQLHSAVDDTGRSLTGE